MEAEGDKIEKIQRERGWRGWRDGDGELEGEENALRVVSVGYQHLFASKRQFWCCYLKCLISSCCWHCCWCRRICCYWSRFCCRTRGKNLCGCKRDNYCCWRRKTVAAHCRGCCCCCCCPDPCCSAGQGVESPHLSPSFSPPPYVIALVVFVGLPCELEWMAMLKINLL